MLHEDFLKTDWKHHDIVKLTNGKEYVVQKHVGEIVGVDKRKVIVVDDVFNTGRTLKAFGKELKKYHAQIVGAVFVSKVFYPPKNKLLAWIKIAFT